MNSTQTDKMTLDTAFHTLLEKTEELGMCEGDYLKMTNLLKKTYEESKKPAPQTIQPIRIELHECFSLQKVVVEITTAEKEEYRLYVSGTVTFHESADTVKTTEFRKCLTQDVGVPKSNRFGPYMCLLSNRFEPSRYEFEIGGYKQTFEYEEEKDKMSSDTLMECGEEAESFVDLSDFRIACMNTMMTSIGNFLE